MGDSNDPNNYRGITIVSCLGKLFTSILCNRIFEWNSENDVITDAQFGFKPGFSTIDAIFVLQSLINRTLKKKKRLYCCFIDYRKAFDFVDRCKLWNKLIRVGVTGKLLCLIKSLYENVKSCIKHNGFLTEFFHPKSGLLQGEVMSPILYSLYVNDFEMHLLSDNQVYPMKDKQSYEMRDEICLLSAYCEWCSKEWMNIYERKRIQSCATEHFLSFHAVLMNGALRK